MVWNSNSARTKGVYNSSTIQKGIQHHQNAPAGHRQGSLHVIIMSAARQCFAPPHHQHNNNTTSTPTMQPTNTPWTTPTPLLPRTTTPHPSQSSHHHTQTTGTPITPTPPSTSTHTHTHQPKPLNPTLQIQPPNLTPHHPHHTISCCFSGNRIFMGLAVSTKSRLEEPAYSRQATASLHKAIPLSRRRLKRKATKLFLGHRQPSPVPHGVATSQPTLGSGILTRFPFGGMFS